MLKALELSGFKSFADKTRFEFHRGITIVVGPNGSGKSNVVDAIKWVLGSQSPKSLRGSEMTDVIFNGSGSRTGLNTAEVTLILDNREKHYPSDAQEVALTRRVYRSGEGEYLINNSPCRLKDIRELLAGTGIGTEAYSIIEQGKVDALLQASPRDRRAIFEEAAGVSRFRTKRQEAARRLARVEQNLLRLSDIVDEVESRLRSVRQQAGKAQRYREATRRLKELRTELGVADWWHIASRLTTLTDEQRKFTDEDTTHREITERGEEELPQLDAEIAEREQALQAVDQQIAQFREAQVASRATAQGIAARRADLATRLEQLEAECAANVPSEEPAPSLNVEAQLQRLANQLQVAADNRQAAEERQLQLADRLQRLRKRYEQLRSQLVELGQQGALSQQQVEHVRQQGEAEQRRASLLEEQLSDLESTHTAASDEAKRLEQLVTQAMGEASQSEEQARQLQLRLAQSQQEYASALRQWKQQEQTLVSLEHRLEFLGEFDRQRREQMEEVHGQLARVYGSITTLAELLHVDVDTAELIEAALGALAEHVVVPTLKPLLAEGAPAGAQLLELDFHYMPTALDHVDLGSLPGVWGRADQFVEVASQYAPLVRRLLGRTWIVDTLATAHHLAASHGKGLHFVTADGEVLTPDGALRSPGSQAKRGGLARAGESDQLADEILRVRPRVAECRKRTEELERAQTEHARVAEEALEASTQATRRLAELKQDLATSQVALTHTAAQLQQLRADVAAATARTHELSLERQGLREKEDAWQQERRKLATACLNVEQSLNVAEMEWEEARDAQRTAELKVARLAEQRDVLKGTALMAQQQHQAQKRREQAQSEMARLREQLTDIERQARQNDGAQAEATQALEGMASKRAAVLQGLDELRTRRTQWQKQLQQARRALDAVQARRHQVEVAIAKLEHERQTLVERLRDEYDIDLPSLAPQRPPEGEKIDRKQLEREIEELRTTLTRIGTVNVDSLEELDQIELRYEAISGQYRDLSQAKAGLEKLMSRLNTESRQLFLATVETVRGHFQELFRRLFGGGEADIVLEVDEGDDAMECGVEIRACPPGKETRNISLLSGGEKTMTCVALLLAMFRSKPSPFCVLDEVDAALDEANVGRFTSVLRDFLSSTQFLVVTHSKKTMTGADTLYGVTMQEGGISKQVSVRFEDVTDDGFIRPSAMLRGDGKKAA